MKSSKEIADTVFRIRDEYLDRKRKRSIKIRKIASCCSAACLCAIVLVCAKNMQLPTVDDWISSSSDTSGSETTQDSTTIKIVTSEDNSEFPATDSRDNQTPSVSTPSTDIHEENKNTGHSDNQSTITTAKSDGNGNNIKTTKHSGSQNSVTTVKSAAGSVNNTKTTKRTTKPNSVTTVKPSGGSVNNTKTTKRTTKPIATTVDESGDSSFNTDLPPTATANPATTKHPGYDPPETNTVVYETPIRPETTIRVVTTISIQTAISPQTTMRVVTVAETEASVACTVSPPHLYSDDETLVKLFSEIYYNGITYQNLLSTETIKEIDSYIGSVALSGYDSSGIYYSVQGEIYKIANTSVDYAVALKFEGYEKYHIYYNTKRKL